MPTILRTRNLRFVIYPNDHPPSHVHVLGPDAEAKFKLKPIELLSSNGFSERDISRIKAFISENVNLLVEAWEDFHGE